MSEPDRLPPWLEELTTPEAPSPESWWRDPLCTLPPGHDGPCVLERAEAALLANRVKP